MNPEFPKFRMITVRNPSHDSLIVRWSIMPTLYPMENITFEIFRSSAPTGPWELVGEAEEGSFHFVDFDVFSLTSFRLYYYIVRAADKTGNGFVDSDHAVLETDPDNIAMGMIRKKNVFLRVKGGIPFAALLRKRWGAKCTRCWDQMRKLAADADCPLCYGTGYVGGFLAPAFIPGMTPSATSKEYVLVDGAKYQSEQAIFEVANFPYLSPDDILVDRVMNVRYNINAVSQSTHRGHIVSQIVRATQLDDNSVIYKYTLPEAAASIKGRSFDMLESK